MKKEVKTKTHYYGQVFIIEAARTETRLWHTLDECQREYDRYVDAGQMLGIAVLGAGWAVVSSALVLLSMYIAGVPV